MYLIFFDEIDFSDATRIVFIQPEITLQSFFFLIILREMQRLNKALFFEVTFKQLFRCMLITESCTHYPALCSTSYAWYQFNISTTTQEFRTVSCSTCLVYQLGGEGGSFSLT